MSHPAACSVAARSAAAARAERAEARRRQRSSSSDSLDSADEGAAGAAGWARGQSMAAGAASSADAADAASISVAAGPLDPGAAASGATDEEEWETDAPDPLLLEDRIRRARVGPRLRSVGPQPARAPQRRAEHLEPPADACGSAGGQCAYGHARALVAEDGLELSAAAHRPPPPPRRPGGASERVSALAGKYSALAEERRQQTLQRIEEERREAEETLVTTAGRLRLWWRGLLRTLSGTPSAPSKEEVDSREAAMRTQHTPAVGQSRSERLQDEQFLNGVVDLMRNPRTVETFAYFDTDGSGEVDMHETRELVRLVSPDTVPGEVEAMLEKLDINRDGTVDLWEFCVHLKLLQEAKTAEDRTLEVDMAFELFRPDEEGHISAAELRRIFCASGGEQLGEDEFSAMLADLGVAADGVIPLHALRNHPSFRA